MRNSVFRTVAMKRWVVVLACSCEDCAAAIPIALAPTSAIPIATATITNLLMLRRMIASTYRTIVALYRRIDFRRCDLHHRFANFSWRLVSCDLNGGDISILASNADRYCRDRAQRHSSGRMSSKMQLSHGGLIGGDHY
jgi:hypothetical protein